MGDADFSADQVRRAVVQQLEGLRRAGVTHWKHVDPVLAPPTTATAAAARPPKSANQSVAAEFAANSVADPGPTLPLNPGLQTNRSGESESSEVAQKKSAVAATVAVPRAPFQPLNLPLADRVAGLAAMAERVKVCTRCQELASTRTQTVFGVGNPEAKILFIGEAPGADEDAQGEPFVGRSGQLLNDIIKACRMRREDIYICNVVRCRPPGNRLPAPEEAANCREYLDGQIAYVNPEYIVCWGACAAQNLLASTETIGKLRGRFFSYGRAKVLCTYHPSYLMRNPAAKKDVWEDMKLLFLEMGIDLTAKV